MLEVAINKLYGTVDLSYFPPSLLQVSFSRNQFSGPLNLGQLPNGIRSFDASHNSFSGDLDLRFLPASLEFLRLANNELGPRLLQWDEDHIPPYLRCVIISENCFWRTEIRSLSSIFKLDAA